MARGDVVKCTTAVFVRGVAESNPNTSDFVVLPYLALLVAAGAAAMILRRKNA